MGGVNVRSAPASTAGGNGSGSCRAGITNQDQWLGVGDGCPGCPNPVAPVAGASRGAADHHVLHLLHSR